MTVTPPFKVSKELTYEEARISCEFFLAECKIKDRNSMRLVQEYIQNDDYELSNLARTLVCLSKGGEVFFVAHAQGRYRYKRLFDFPTVLIKKIIEKLHEVSTIDNYAAEIAK